MKAFQGKARYVPGDSCEVDEEANSLISTTYALRFLYEDALRNRHYRMASVLQDTLNFCEEIVYEEIVPDAPDSPSNHNAE